MRLIRGLYNLPAAAGRVVSIGNFDGVHRGHQALLTRLVACAREQNLSSTVLLFEPQPLEFFLADQAPARLMRWHDKFEAIRDFGVDEILVLRFDARLRALSAEAFVTQVLQRIACRWLIVGDDFRFGCDRQGDFAYLQRAGGSAGFVVQDSASIQVQGQRVSSTLLREALAMADFARVRAYLGHDFCISGRVMRGDQLGRQLGFPTANLQLRRQVWPLAGVYVVRVDGADAKARDGVANIGVRPTIAGVSPRLEVHLLDYAADLYGRRLRVSFLGKLRDERQFAGLPQLVAAIGRDVEQAREFLSNRAMLAPDENV